MVYFLKLIASKNQNLQNYLHQMGLTTEPDKGKLYRETDFQLVLSYETSAGTALQYQ